jgi:hypothetical protein
MTAPAAVSPSVAAREAAVGAPILPHFVSCGDTNGWVDCAAAPDVLAGLHRTPRQELNYLTDHTALA